ncbi:hypothetical protein GGX14DRAFT_576208 [Mycena pura]|uniref:Uncharacterized protein n=1 Tax=Mycena pura TaxID=153505 RepID=A0AAD6UYB8_9AGAR|nr:hypothetical protein GGX14DRAFT_576208 [Mycena pura]
MASLADALDALLRRINNEFTTDNAGRAALLTALEATDHRPLVGVLLEMNAPLGRPLLATHPWTVKHCCLGPSLTTSTHYRAHTNYSAPPTAASGAPTPSSSAGTSTLPTVPAPGPTRKAASAAATTSAASILPGPCSCPGPGPPFPLVGGAVPPIPAFLANSPPADNGPFTSIGIGELCGDSGIFDANDARFA